MYDLVERESGQHCQTLANWAQARPAAYRHARTRNRTIDVITTALCWCAEDGTAHPVHVATITPYLADMQTIALSWNGAY